jgi:hypothetical protein
MNINKSNLNSPRKTFINYTFLNDSMKVWFVKIIIFGLTTPIILCAVEFHRHGWTKDLFIHFHVIGTFIFLMSLFFIFFGYKYKKSF